MSANNSLEVIFFKMKNLPTIMKMEDEIKIIKEIMSISTIEIRNNEDIFYKILQDICLSHEYNWYLLKNSDIEVTNKFVETLNKMDFLQDVDFLDDVVWMLSLTPNNPPREE